MHDVIKPVIESVLSRHPSQSGFDDCDKTWDFAQYSTSTCTLLILGVNVRKSGEEGLIAGRAAAGHSEPASSTVQVLAASMFCGQRCL